MPTVHLGLTSKEVARLFARFGPNELKETKRASPLRMFLSQFRNILMLLLAFASLVSFIAKEHIDGVFILLIIVLNAALGFVQEYKAENALRALKNMARTMVRVIRDGKEELIDSTLLVPGDAVKLTQGDRIPADGTLVESLHLEVNEASITGESLPAAKSSTDEVNNAVFMGTIVASGKAIMKVTTTGMHSRFGRMAASLTTIADEETPLSRKISILGKQLTAMAVIVVVCLFFLGIAASRPIIEMLLVSISLAVAAVPEGLPAVITITLAVGLQRMARQKAILRKLSAIEALGNTTIIVTDKTGTLTENKMRVVKLWYHDTTLDRTRFSHTVISRPSLNLFIQCGIVCNNASLIFKPESRTPAILGDQTEGSLLLMASELGIDPENVREKGAVVEEYAFDADLKRMSVIWQQEGKLTVFTKGAPESILAIATKLYSNGRIVAMTPARMRSLHDKIAVFAEKGLRVLALAYKETNRAAGSRQRMERDLTFLGFVGIADPARPKVAETISLARRAGIETIMVTGDNPLTAKSIGIQIGLVDSTARVLTGDQMRSISDADLTDLLRTVRIVARTVPEDKYRIVRLLQENGHIVTVTGDGVNDALAIKKADVGVAMGITGSDVTKEVADMVITDDNFVSIVNAIREGRVIFHNIVKSIVYLVSCNLGEVFALCVGIAMGLPVPLLPIQLLWINLVTDGLPALSLAFDPASRSVMSKLSHRNGAIIGRHNMPFIAFSSVTIGLVTLALYAYTLTVAPVPYARMVAFNALVVLQMIMAFVVRKDAHPFSNPLLVASVTLSLCLQILITALPVLRIFFHIQ